MIKLGNLEKFYESGAGRTYVLRQINVEVKEGVNKVSELSNLINKPVHLEFEELQPGLIEGEE